MADTTRTCGICSNSFDEIEHVPFMLPCNHDFCLTCLVRQKTSGNHKCAKCLNNWETIQLPALVAEKRERVEALCRKHQFLFAYWCNSKKELYCKKCATEQENVKLELVEEAVPLMKADTIKKVSEFIDSVDCGVPCLDEHHLKLKECLLGVQSFMKDLQKLEEDLLESLTETETLKAESLNGKIRAQEIIAMNANVETGSDAAVVLKSRAEVEDLPELDFSPVLPSLALCNIVFSYLDVKELEGRDASYSFLSKFIKVDGISLSFLRAALTFSESLEDGAEWSAGDEISRLGVLLALFDGKPKPSCLTFRKQQGLHYPSNVVAEAARIGKDSEFKAEFLDSFLHMRHTDIDKERLNSLLANSSLRLVTFVGHLDPASIAKLPPTIRTLGLAIKTAAEAEAVSSLCPWEMLDTLHVCVGEDIIVDDLKPLPRVHTKILHFNFKDVDRMRPALDALIPTQQEQYGCVQLHLPTSMFGISEALRLAEHLRGSPINKGIIIESCNGELTETHKLKLVRAFREGVAGGNPVHSFINKLNTSQSQGLQTVFNDMVARDVTIDSCFGELIETQQRKLVSDFRAAAARYITMDSCVGLLTSTQKQKLVAAFRAVVAADTGGSHTGKLTETERQEFVSSFTEAVTGGITIESELTSTQRQKLVRLFTEVTTGYNTIESCVGELTETQRRKLVRLFTEAVTVGITIESNAEELTSTQRRKLVRTFREAVTGGITYASCVGKLTWTQRQKLVRSFTEAAASDIKNRTQSPSLENFLN